MEKNRIKCLRCHIVKHEEEFYFIKKDGYRRSICKSCKSKEYREAHGKISEKRRIANENWKKKYKDFEL